MDNQSADDRALRERLQVKTKELYGGGGVESRPPEPSQPILKLKFTDPTVHALARVTGDYTELMVKFGIGGRLFEIPVQVTDMEARLFNLSREAEVAMAAKVARAILKALSGE